MKQKRNGCVDCCKFLMSILIMLGHYSYWFSLEYGTKNLESRMQFLFDKYLSFVLVSAFFFLSGFYIFENNKNNKVEFISFIKKRFSNIFPLYSLSIIFFLIVSIVFYYNNHHFFGGKDFNFELVFFTLMGMQSWLKLPLNINGPLWFCSVLFFLYILFVFINNSMSWKGFFILFFIGLSYFYIQNIQSDIPFYTYHFCIGYVSFSFGILFNVFWNKSNKVIKIFYLVIIGLSFICMLMSFFLKKNYFGGKEFFSIFIIEPLIIYICNVPFLEKWFSNNFFYMLGNLSFPIYFFHIPIFIFSSCILGNVNYLEPVYICLILMSSYFLSLFSRKIKNLSWRLY